MQAGKSVTDVGTEKARTLQGKAFNRKVRQVFAKTANRKILNRRGRRGRRENLGLNCEKGKS